jgi:hypothetical protein
MIQADGTIIRLSSEYLDRPTSISIDAQGNLCVVDNNAVSVYTPTFVIESDPVSIEVTGMSSSFTYTLHTGWNLVSVPLNPSDNNFNEFFPDSVKSHVVVVWAYNASKKGWTYYTPRSGYDPNTLTTVDTMHGYWVKVDQDITFTISGTAGNAATLVQGWNLVGYPALTTGDPAKTYAGTIVTWQYKNGQWYYYTPQSGYDPNTLTGIEPGYGYWVKEA